MATEAGAEKLAFLDEVRAALVDQLLRGAREGPGGLQQRLEECAVAIEEHRAVSVARLLEATGKHRA